MGAHPKVAQTSQYELGSCPNCRQAVVAKVSVEVSVGAVTVLNGNPRAETTSRITGVEVHHVCSGQPTAEQPARVYEI